MAIDNIKIAEQLKKLQEEMNNLVDQQTRSLKNQLDVVKAIAESFSSMNNAAGDTVSNLEKTHDALSQAAESADKLGTGGAMTDFAKAIKDSVEKSDNLTASLRKAVKLLPGFSTFTGIWEGFTAGISGTANALSLFGSTTMTALEALGQLALSVISFPFKILGNLINFASQGGGDNSLRQALEDIRKEFGDLRKSSAKAIIDIARGMKGELANTGLSVWRTFGRLADRLKTIAEYAKNMGNLFANLAGQFVKNSEALGAYFKGLHLTEEGQKGVATRAYALGQDLTEVTRQIANYSVQLADEFGQSAAQVSQDVGDMMDDFEHFGGMAPQVLTQISVYARRLGVEVKGLLGVIDQFDNFEDAARSAAQLTQAFGLQLDALQLLKAQDPAERTEMLRKSFFAAGRSVETMTRQERALLQQQTGLDASTLDLVFSQKNQALSYDQVKKKSDAARKSQLTQEQALTKIAGAIERLVRSGSMGGGGFFERFFQGFERGIVWSREFRKLMIDIRMALRATYYAGVQVGRMFVQMFPGVQDLLKGLDQLFDRNRFRSMLKSLTSTFREFFTSLTSTNGRNSFRNLMENLKRMFWNYFDRSTPGGRQILDGVKNFSKAVSVIIGGLIRETAKGITQGIRFISDLLSGRQRIDTGGVGGSALGFIGELLTPILDALKEAWPPLVAALEQLWSEEIWPRVKNFLVDHAGAISLVLFGPAFARAFIGGIVSSVGGSLIKGFTTAFTDAFASTAVRNAASSGLQNIVGGAANPATIQAAAASTTATGEVAAAAQAAPITGATIARMALVGLVITVGVAAIVAAIWGIAELMKSRGLTTRQMLSAGAVLAVAGGVMVELAGAVSIISGAGKAIEAASDGLLVGMAAVGVVAVAMGAGIYAMVDALKGFEPAEVDNALKAMLGGAAFIAAATGVLIGATAIGAIFVATGGTALAAAAAGFLAIGLTTDLMVKGTQSVIEAVGGLHIPGDFDRKFEIFTQAMESVGTFAGTIVSLAEATSHSSIWNWFTGNGAQQQIDSLKAVTNVMESLTSEMMDLVKGVIRQVDSLSVAPEQLQKAELFGRIMSSIGDMAKNLQPPEGLLQADSSLFGSNIDERLISLGVFVNSLGTALRGVLKAVVEQLNNISLGGGFSEGALRSFEAVGHMLEVIGALSRNMLMIVNQQYSGLSSEELSSRIPVVTEIVNTLLTSIFTGGSSGLISAMANLIQQMTSQISGLSDRDVSRLSSLAPVLKAAFEAIATIGDTVSNLGTLVSGISPTDQAAAIGTIRAIVGNMLYGIRDVISGLIESTKGLFAGLSPAQTSQLVSGVNAVKGMIEAVVGLPPALTELYNSLSEGTGGQYEAITARLGTIISLFYDDAAHPASLPVFFRQVAQTFNSIPEITGDPATKLDQMAKGLSSLNVIREIDFNSIITGIEANSEAIKAQAFQQLGQNIRSMVEEVNSIATDLGAVQTVNINTSLKALAGRLGLGESEELTINNRNFNVDVSVNVHIDAQELERVLLDRPNSRILSRGGGGGGR